MRINPYLNNRNIKHERENYFYQLKNMNSPFNKLILRNNFCNSEKFFGLWRILWDSSMLFRILSSKIYWFILFSQSLSKLPLDDQTYSRIYNSTHLQLLLYLILSSNKAAFMLTFRGSSLCFIELSTSMLILIRDHKSFNLVNSSIIKQQLHKVRVLLVDPLIFYVMASALLNTT